MTGRFDGKVALITGGGSGIGEGTVRRFVREGGKVGIVDRDIENARTVAASIGDAVAVFTADVTREAEVEEAVGKIVKHFGRLDVTVNCAGVGSGVTPIHEVSEERWRRTLSTNLDGTFLVLKHAARAMIACENGGVIVNMTSCLAAQASAGVFYGVSKAAVDMLTKIAALDLIPFGIRVVAVGPGLTNTPMNAAAISSVPETLAAFMDNIPLQRMANIDEIVSAILYLASDEASYIIGTSTYVDGGILLRKYPTRVRTE